MIFYSVFSGHGRDILADTLDAEDPFGLEPGVIVERVTAMGFTPAVESPRTEPWPSPGRTHEVSDADGRTFLVSIGRDAETILVQEARIVAYEEE